MFHIPCVKKVLISVDADREIFLGEGIFNRDDEVRALCFHTSFITLTMSLLQQWKLVSIY